MSLLLSLVSVISAVSATQSFTVKNGNICDECGRARLFHGLNAVEKRGSYLPATTGLDFQDILNSTDAERMKSWGMNVVRLGVMWPGVMPEENVVNMTYLAEVKSLIEMLSSNGISTLVDLHQDVWSKKLCGEGMPDWAFEKGLNLVGFNFSDEATAFPKPLPFDVTIGADGYPEDSSCMEHGFFLYYTSFESERLWHAVYSQPAMWDSLAAHWSAVAAFLKGTPGLLGYEMLNEPWPARGADPRFLSDAHTLGGLYSALAAAVRAADPTTPFFFEPLVLESYLDVLPNRTTDFPEGGFGPSSVLAYHSYCPPGGAFAFCRELVHAAWQGVDRNLAHLGDTVGGFLTEFGAVGEDEDSLKLVALQAEQADQRLQGWAYWTYKSFNDVTTQNAQTETLFRADGTVQLPKAKALARTYARAVAGKPLSMAFDPATSAFALSFTTAGAAQGGAQGAIVDGAACGATEVFLHLGFYYPDGYRVSVSEGLAWAVSEEGDSAADGGRWAVLSITSNLPLGSVVNVAISRAL